MNQEKKSSHLSIFLAVILALVLLKVTIVTYKFAQKNYIISEHKNELEKVNLLLQYGYVQDLNKRSTTGETKLWWACYNNDFELTKYLIENGAQESINWADDYGDTPLWWACFRNNIDIAKLLLENGAQPSVNVISDYEYTPVTWACKNNYTQIVKLLTFHGAITDKPESCANNPRSCTNKSENYYWLPIYYACCNGNLKIVKYLVKNNAINSLKKAHKNKINAISTKINTCINPNVYTSINTNIHASINADAKTHTNTPQTNIFTHYLPYTPTPYSKIITKKFFSTLYYACFDNNLDLINFTLFGPYRKFISQNQDLNYFTETEDQENLLLLLHLAALSGNTQIIKYLIENYAD